MVKKVKMQYWQKGWILGFKHSRRLIASNPFLPKGFIMNTISKLLSTIFHRRTEAEKMAEKRREEIAYEKVRIAYGKFKKGMVGNKPICPMCESNDTVKISYGRLPQYFEDFGEPEKRVWFNGCIINDNSPIWHCFNCDHDWGSFNEFQNAI